MDDLLELLDEYRCHLNRGDVTMTNFLENNFKAYIKSLRDAAASTNNITVGKEMIDLINPLIDNIEENARRIVNVFQLYNDGQIIKSGAEAFEVINDMKPYLMYRSPGNFRKDIFYRIRIADDTNKGISLSPKDLFHIPHKLNYLVKTERYSMPGHPCLYIASMPELCWYECGCPSEFHISKFDVPQTESSHLTLIDFSEKLMPLMHSFFCWFHNETNTELVRNYLLKYLYTYPLRAACSVQVKYPDASFKEEYIMSQFLLQWVVQDNRFDGISYESCSNYKEVGSLGGYNVVLPTKKFDSDGYDINLRKQIKVAPPSYIDINTLEYDPQLKDATAGRDIKTDPFFWNLEDISDHYSII